MNSIVATPFRVFQFGGSWSSHGGHYVAHLVPGSLRRPSFVITFGVGDLESTRATRQLGRYATQRQILSNSIFDEK